MPAQPETDAQPPQAPIADEPGTGVAEEPCAVPTAVEVIDHLLAEAPPVC